MGCKSASARDICEISASIGGFRVGPSNAANEILSRPSLVAIATKFRTKWAITRLLLEISVRSLRS